MRLKCLSSLRSSEFPSSSLSFYVVIQTLSPRKFTNNFDQFSPFQARGRTSSWYEWWQTLNLSLAKYLQIWLITEENSASHRRSRNYKWIPKPILSVSITSKNSWSEYNFPHCTNTFRILCIQFKFSHTGHFLSNILIYRLFHTI